MNRSLYRDYLRRLGIDLGSDPSFGNVSGRGGAPALNGPLQVLEGPGRLIAEGGDPNLGFPSPKPDRYRKSPDRTLNPSATRQNAKPGASATPPTRSALPRSTGLSTAAPSASASTGGAASSFGSGFPFNRPKEDLSTLGTRIASGVKGAIAGNRPNPFDRPPFASGTGQSVTSPTGRSVIQNPPPAGSTGRVTRQDPQTGTVFDAKTGELITTPYTPPGRTGGPRMPTAPSASGTAWNEAENRARGIAPPGGQPSGRGDLPRIPTAQRPTPSAPAPTAPAPSGTTAAPSGTVGSFGDVGQDPTLDQYNDAYLAASSSTGVPANIIKGIQATENGWGGVGFGEQNCTVRPDAGCLNLWTGVFETTAQAHGIDYQRTLTDPAYAIWSVGKVMGDIAADDSSAWGGQGGGTVLDQYGWEGVINVYFSGNVGGGFTDETGRPTGQYNADVMAKINDLGGIGAPATGGASVGAPAAPAAGPGTDPAASPIGSGTVTSQRRSPAATGAITAAPASDGMGVKAGPGADESYLSDMAPGGLVVSTDYKQPVTWDVPALGSNPYGYQDGHGADGTTHAAYDLTCSTGQGTCYGTPISSPVDGTVVCSGGQGQVPDAGGFDCNYATGCTFEDNCGPGQVTIQTDPDVDGNGIYLNTIHLGGSTVTPGQQISAGDQYGTMGSMGGLEHVHFEAWGNCNGTFVYLDPTLVVDGYYDSHSVCEGF